MRNCCQDSRESNDSYFVMDNDHFQALYSQEVLSAFTVAYVCIFFIGLLGNILTCLVVLRRHYVHSQTPFYLNLAFSDLLLLMVGLPVDVYFFWHPYRPLGGTWFCIMRAMITESATNASILTIIVFTAERWISICHPSKCANSFSNASSQGFLGPAKSARFIAAIWVTSLIAATPLSAQLGIVPILDQHTQQPMPDVGVCHVIPDRAIPYSFEASSLVFFVIPMILITGFYSSIIAELRRTVARHSSVNDSPLMNVAGRARQQAKASGAVVKILIAVVVAFFVCFSPHHLQRLLASYLSDRGDANSAQFAQLLFTISGLSYYISTAVNPVIYCLLSKRFRFALEHLLKCRRRRRKTAGRAMSKDIPLINQLQRRALIMKAHTYQGACATVFGGSRIRLRYPISCPLARKHGVQIPFMNENQIQQSPPMRPHTLSVSSVYGQPPQSRSVSPNRPKSSQSSPRGKVANNLIKQCAQSDCYNVYFDGEKLVISFLSDLDLKQGNSV